MKISFRGEITNIPPRFTKRGASQMRDIVYIVMLAMSADPNDFVLRMPDGSYVSMNDDSSGVGDRLSPDEVLFMTKRPCEWVQP